MDLRNSLAAFVPRTVWPLVDGAGNGSRKSGSVLFADLAGFTRLTDSLASIGKEGAEELTRILNEFFSSMIKIVHEDGGDVLRFGGDAMTIFMPSGPGEALKTALRLQAETAKYGAVETRAGVFALGMKIGVSFGDTVFSIVGDGSVGFDYFAAGSALDLSAECEHRAGQGNIVVCPRASEKIDFKNLRTVVLEGGFTMVEGPDNEAPPENGPVRSEELQLPSEEALSEFLPFYIKDKLETTESFLVGEHRRTTVLFLSFKAEDYERDPSAVETARVVYRETGRLVKKYGGFINKIDMGDKGSKVLAIFGSPLAVERQEEMGCRCALDIVSNPELSGINENIRIGLTVSSVFSAYVGCPERREYTVMGNGINLAARLMAACAPGSVLASEEVYEKASSAIEFDVLTPINVKGKTEKVPVFSPTRKTRGASEASGCFVGRKKELSEALEALRTGSSSPGIAVTGAAGVGKSLFLCRLKDRLHAEGLECIVTNLASYDRDKYMGAWRGIILHCLGAGDGGSAPVRVDAILSQMNEEDREYLPLFNDILNIEVPENASTKALSSKDRKDVFFAIISRLILRNTADAPHRIFIDHMDYADPSSVEFLGEIATDLKGTQLKIAFTLRDSASQLLKDAAEGFGTLQLGPFSEEEVRSFLLDVAGFAPPTETFVSFLLKKTGGNPKFLEEVLQIMTREQLAFKGPSSLLEVDEDRLSSASFPDTLQGLFLSRVESLPETERQILKTASILGPSFSIHSLSSILEKPAVDVADEISAMESSGLIKMDTWGERPYASFTDNLLRDAIYDSLNFQIRREMHRKVAESLESLGSEEPRINPVLARHFEFAGEEEKALGYLWKSAEFSRSFYDNRSAFDFLGRFVAISEKRGKTPSADRQFLDALMYYADVQQELGRIQEADLLYKRILDEIKEVSQDTVKATSRLADNKRRTGAVKESLELFDKALDGAKKLKDEALQCRIFLDSGVPLAMTGKMGKAMDHFQRAENLAAKIGDFPSLVYALMNRGLVEYFKGKLEGAKSLLLKAREVAKEHDLKSYLALITVNLAQVHFEMGEYEKALAICREAVEVSRQFGYRNHLVLAMANQALYETMLCEWDDAGRSVEKALTLARHYEMAYPMAINLHTKSLILFGEGCFTEAVKMQLSALDIYMANNQTSEALGCLSEIAFISNFLRMPELINTTLEKFIPGLQSELQNVTRTWTIGFTAHQAFHKYITGEADLYDSVENMENILERARESGILWLVADVGKVLINLHQSDGNHAKAAETGMDLFPLLSTHFCPLILPRFMISLAESLLETDGREDLSSVLDSLKTYDKYLEKGPFGLEYCLLRKKLAEKDGEDPAPFTERGRRLARLMIESEMDEEVREALMKLPAFAKFGAGT
ncbi:MAG TPA: adenylate/guanylate cyclase domain-containing protein [Acidobacteriota bacterium]|nr:adenylate/guanylate cyclase domain-containing protein [Acidobacteriota bacterium]HQO19005.1 adenylate/guanylate cyclase domain-containing protein [Acidobacteriota bacterium]HQQ45898.1 adenylate/guanylate cyclase domain-containing protein [Acidobacteriota bacterium]